ncbi:MAG: DUF2218 domain-containing protein [Pseudomonadota bacterium]
MSETFATFKTEYASRYLQQLCKHFGHKVPTSFTPTEGRVALPFGECNFTAIDGLLTLRATAAESRLPKVERFLADHLARFAFREPHTLVWRRTA